MGEHGVSLENMEKMENINHMIQITLFMIQNAIHDLKHSILQDLSRQLKNQNICAWITRSAQYWRISTEM